MRPLRLLCTVNSMTKHQQQPSKKGNRDRTLCIRVNDRELAAIERGAKLEHLSVSAYLRRLALRDVDRAFKEANPMIVVKQKQEG